MNASDYIRDAVVKCFKIALANDPLEYKSVLGRYSEEFPQYTDALHRVTKEFFLKFYGCKMPHQGMSEWELEHLVCFLSGGSLSH
jgi:hypothetical protein